MALQDNLVSYWKLDGNSNDSVGSNNGTDSNVSYNASYGKIGQGALFNGISSYISTPTGSRITANGTISCWFKTTSTATYQEIFGNETANEYHRVAMTATGQIYVYILTGGVEKVNLTSTQTYRDGLWHHLVMRWGIGGMKIYVDGVNILSSADTSYGNGTVGIQIGVNYNVGTRVWYFNGNIDEFGFWSRALTSTEITQLYNSGAGLTYPFTTTSTPNFLPFFQQIYN